MSEVDLINHPPHYTHSAIEVIDAIEEWGLGFHLGNSIKYIARAGKKDGSSFIDDLKKARWYLDRKIKETEDSLTPPSDPPNTNRLSSDRLGQSPK